MEDVPGERSPELHGPSGPPPTGYGPRASDADRDRFAALLEHHFAAGRLTEDEFSERMDRVLHTRSLGDLYALVADLPDLPAVAAPRARHGSKRRIWRFWRA